MPTIDERIALLKKMHSDEMVIMAAKANDYSGTEDCNKNIKACEVMGLCSAEVGLLIRIGDKIQRLNSLVAKRNKMMVDEGLMDTIMDTRNYLCILAHILQEKGLLRERE